MKNLLFVLILTLLSCEGMMTTQNTKPTITTFNPPDSNVEVVSGDPQTNGYTDGVDYIAGSNYNAFWRQEFRVADYLLNDERNIYVKCTSGDDTTGDGTELLPYKTIEKAYSMIAPNAFTKIWMYEDGLYPVNVDIDVYAKKVAILQYPGITASVKFVSYTDTATNMLYRFNLYHNSSLIIFADTIVVDDPDDVGNPWGFYASCVRVYDGISNVVFATASGISFSATPASLRAPSLVMPGVASDSGSVGMPIVQTKGDITTNLLGFVLDSLEQSAVLNSAGGTIDNANYWVANGVAKTKVSALDTVMEYNSSGAPFPTITLTARGSSQVIDAADTAADQLVDIKAFITEVYPDITASDITAVVTVLTGDILGIEITISGTSATVPIIDAIGYLINGSQRYMNLTTQGRSAVVLNNYNVLTNIEDLR